MARLMNALLMRLQLKTDLRLANLKSPSRNGMPVWRQTLITDRTAQKTKVAE